VSETLRTLQDLFLVFTSVLFIVDPLTAVPTFLAMTLGIHPKCAVRWPSGALDLRHHADVLRSGGSLIFRLFGITIAAFKVAGGVLIGLNALDMVQARRSQQRETAVEKAEGSRRKRWHHALGVPMLAGPGPSRRSWCWRGVKERGDDHRVYVAIALTAFLTYVTLAAAPRVERKLGQTGMRILTRLMGWCCAPSPCSSFSMGSRCGTIGSTAETLPGPIRAGLLGAAGSFRPSLDAAAALYEHRDCLAPAVAHMRRPRSARRSQPRRRGCSCSVESRACMHLLTSSGRDDPRGRSAFTGLGFPRTCIPGAGRDHKPIQPIMLWDCDATYHRAARAADASELC